MSKLARRFVKGTQIEVVGKGPWTGQTGTVVNNYRQYSEAYVKLDDGRTLYCRYSEMVPYKPGPDRIEELFT